MRYYVPMSSVSLQARAVTITLLIVMVVIVGLLGGGFAAQKPHPEKLVVHFLNVGQGDATLIETPDGVQVLIDGGRDAGVLRELGKLMSWGDRSIDMIIATHPDQDHISGLVDVLDRFAVGVIVLTDNDHSTPTSEAFLKAIANEGAQIQTASQGQTFLLGASTTLSILSPATTTVGVESNSASIVAKLSFGETDFLFTGDAPSLIEMYLAGQYGSGLESEVLKVGHHGSDTSSAQLFLEAVAPAYAIISAGKNNRYGHPHQEVLERLRGIEATILQTQNRGTISVASDGTTITIE